MNKKNLLLLVGLAFFGAVDAYASCSCKVSLKVVPDAWGCSNGLYAETGANGQDDGNAGSGCGNDLPLAEKILYSGSGGCTRGSCRGKTEGRMADFVSQSTEQSLKNLCTQNLGTTFKGRVSAKGRRGTNSPWYNRVVYWATENALEIDCPALLGPKQCPNGQQPLPSGECPPALVVDMDPNPEESDDGVDIAFGGISGAAMNLGTENASEPAGAVQMAAATAGKDAVLGLPGSKRGLMGADGDKGFSTLGKGKSGFGGGNSGGSGGSLFGNDTSAKPSDAEKQKQMLAAIDADVAGSTYGAGGRGAAGSGNGNRDGFGIGVAGAVQGELAFGSRQPASVDALAGEDPDDYFARLGLEENLFKVVEKRYRKKTTPWFLGKALP